MSEYERLISKWNPRLGYGGPRYVDTPINGVCKGYGVRSALQEYWYIYVRMLAQATKECEDIARAVRKIKNPTPEQQIVRYRTWNNHWFQLRGTWGVEHSVHILYFDRNDFAANAVNTTFSIFEQSIMIPSTASGDAPSEDEFLDQMEMVMPTLENIVSPGRHGLPTIGHVFFHTTNWKTC